MTLTKSVIATGHAYPDEYWPIFNNNLIADMIVLIGGLVLSIPSVISSIYNGLMFGSIVGVDQTFGLVGLIPHGIFEFFSTVFSLTGALIITKFEINLLKSVFEKEGNIKESLKNSKYVYKDLILILIILVILVAIGAFIETQVDCYLMNAFYHI